MHLVGSHWSQGSSALICLTLLLSVLLFGGCANQKVVVVPQPPVQPPEPPNPIQEELRLTGNEQYPGQTALTDKVGKDNLKGTVFHPEELGDEHAELVRGTLINAGVPESHIITEPGELHYNGVSNLPEGARVAVLPFWGGGFWEPDGVFLAEQDALIAVGSAGNVWPDNDELMEYAGRDWYRADIEDYYFEDGSYVALGRNYRNVMAALRAANGKAVLATWAIVNADGTASPWEYAVMCGDTMEWCFAVRMPDDLYRNRADNGYPGTSLASPILGAHAFYLSQLWNTADEVFNVLKECAVDIGEPGPDREFGLGVPSAICPTVQGREQQAAGSSLSVAGGSAAISALLAGGETSVSFGRQPNLTLSFAPRAPDLFVSFSSLAAGKTFGSGMAAYTALVGMGRSPLVSSSLVRQRWSAFAETGLKRTFLSRGDTSVSFLAAAGAQGGPVRSYTGRTGLALHRPSFTVYGGATFAAATVPIPGHEAVGVPPASVSRMGWEVSLHRSFSFGAR